MTGRLEQIWLKRAHRGSMDAVPSVAVDPAQGLVGSVDRSSRRQATLLEREAWEAMMQEIGAAFDPSARRANLLLSGIRLARTRGGILRIGDVRLEIGGETTPCERMEALHPGLQESMRTDWRGGAFGRFLDAGVLRVGDLVEWTTG
jgi:MOSC domain-containing protein YiiM